MNKRKKFLIQMIKESMKPYEIPGEEFTVDEIKLLPKFISNLKENSLILDLAGGYGRITKILLNNNFRVVLLDLSINSIKIAKKNLSKYLWLDIIHADMNHQPFKKHSFNAIWFSQAFEYIPPEHRSKIIRNLSELLKNNGILFINIAHIMGECSLIKYLLNYLYWKIIKRKPIKFGDYIYKLKLNHYEGWHYHSLIMSRRNIEKTLKMYFKIIDKVIMRKGYHAYLLRKLIK